MPTPIEILPDPVSLGVLALYGTLRNPRGYEMETGFYEGASARIPEMLCFKDVSEPPVAGRGGQRLARA